MEMVKPLLALFGVVLGVVSVLTLLRRLFFGNWGPRLRLDRFLSFFPLSTTCVILGGVVGFLVGSLHGFILGVSWNS